MIVGQPWSGDGQPAHGVADVRVQVVPGEDDGTAELLLACIQQPDVVGLVEALAAVFGQPARWIRWSAAKDDRVPVHGIPDGLLTRAAWTGPAVRRHGDDVRPAAGKWSTSTTACAKSRGASWGRL